MAIDATQYFKVVYGQTAVPAASAAQAVPELVDANGDGILDILVFGAYYPFNGSAPSGQTSWLLQGKADGTFTPSQSLLPSTFKTVHPREVVQADFNKDGLKDLYVADHGYDAQPFPGYQNGLLFGKPGGGYTDGTANLPHVADFTHSTSAADINGDGNLDIFVGNMSGLNAPAEMYVLFGDGKGGFTRSDAGLPVHDGGYLDRSTNTTGFTASLLADLNGDGRPDLVLGNEGNHYNSDFRSLVYWNTGAGFSASNITFLPQGYFGDYRIVHDIAATDIDGDGDNDLLLLSSESRPTNAYADGWSLEVLRNDGGTFVNDTSSHFQAGATQEGLPNENSGIGASQFIRLMDVNADGTEDIVVTQFMNQRPTSETPIVWTNDGFGHYEVALRAGQLNTLTNDPYFISSFALPYVNENGLNIVSFGEYQGTVYTKTVQPLKPLPAAANITASARADTIQQNRADNVIDGGAGMDKVVYSKGASSYTVTAQTGGFRIVDKTGADGTDTVTNVERLRFSDSVIALDIEGVAGQAYRVYQAAFARTPDLGGLGWWINAMDNGSTLASVAQGFVNSQEFKDVYGANPTNAQLVAKFYENVLRRPGEQAGIDFWTSVLDGGHATVADVLMGFSEGFENKAALVGVTANGIAYTPYGGA